MNYLNQILNTLSIADGSFKSLRIKNKIYVDKTEIVYKLACDDTPKVLSRPRRFGKSTLLSTIEELFLHGVKPYDGHDSYFKGLVIEKLWHDDGKYIVLKLDFATIDFLCDSAVKFEKKLCESLLLFANSKGIKIEQHPADLADCFRNFLAAIPNNSLVLLIDEHDAPIVKRLYDKKEKEFCIEILRTIYGMVKSNPIKFRCVFVTGITRYKDLQLGTAGNALIDVSLQPKYGESCGYTRDELKGYFEPYLRNTSALKYGKQLGEVETEDIEKLLDEMAEWYDGFCFDDEAATRVFSTWSVLNFFSEQRAAFLPYWADDDCLGQPNILRHALSKIDLPSLVTDLEDGEFRISRNQFNHASLTNPEANPYALLYQSGYLTLCDSIIERGEVCLDCPNREIHTALYNLVSRLLSNEEELFSPAFSRNVRKVLACADADKITDFLNRLFATIPYQNYPVNSESAVVTLTSFYFRGAELDVDAEVSESIGRSDLAVHLEEQDLSLIFEFKFTAKADNSVFDSKLTEACEQIKSRDYGNTLSSCRRIERFALVFCGEKEVRRFVRQLKVNAIVR